MNFSLASLPLLLAAASAGAQVPPLPPPPGAPPPAAVDVQTLSGSVKQYLLAPHGEVDGLLLTDGTQVAVPPHLQAALMSSVKPNDAVHITGNRESASRIVAQQIDDTTSGAHVIDNGPDGAALPPPPDDSTMTSLSATGNVSTLLSGPRGEINGAVLDDGTVIRFAPRTGLYYADQLKLGTNVSPSGMGTQNTFGRVIDVQELRAN